MNIDIFMDLMKVATDYRKYKIRSEEARYRMVEILRNAIIEGKLDNEQAQELLQFIKTKKARKIYKKLKSLV
ncbi:hypothetical protein [Rummeliibacillus suwonensis]|uniref:hypothetical protein n=1 Tax=Rummeliibacillus suwonensis TaxID=1306154 RepID=UPI001AAFA7FC|nr:hypothetical protein [Rummeliibacillus suwonensis]MBO2536298.1 hypothetical protein [Rummeliibacillus suwonensis]